MLIGKRLKELRELKGLSQEDLGKLVNLSQQTIGHYEVDRAEPKSETLNILADYFQVSVDYLLGRSNSPWPKLITPPDMSPSPEDIKALSDKIEELLKGLTPEERKEKIQKMIMAIEFANELEKKKS